MGYNRNKVLETALLEEGYMEKKDASSLDTKTGNAGRGNYTKYSRDLAAVNYFNGRKQGVAWCAVFVAWCFFRAYGKEGALRLLNQPSVAANNAGAGCRHAMNYFKAKGRFYAKQPEPGDVIFFYESDMVGIAHAGIVYRVDENKVYTVEGNTSGASGVVPNGGAVCCKEYYQGFGRIVGYGRPAYDDGGVEASTDEADERDEMYDEYTVQKGDSLWEIAKKLMGSGGKYTLIQSANGISGSLIRIGQKLKIPKEG